MNRGYIGTTLSFAVYLYALDTAGTQYPIAMQSSALTFSDFTPGPIT